MASRGFCVCPHVNWAALILNGFSDADADVPVMNLEQIGRRAILKVSVSEEAIVIPWRSWPDVPLSLKSKEPSVYG
ncbi:hypothetical protein CY34DRAFT_193819 [Suillus luteus UH-Slu-Lm8-n1]|uniref:Uncharacterized protein n=1 Tax=Suillus luteus UH-Slu-Lm8-n1 TaxID=930992 RepID=A0A0D0BPV0_9AGAM|nr:hypothetical protein CY34DRAFT_193819 [Suillus luteus UH-Slu-Lm8-n1]